MGEQIDRTPVDKSEWGEGPWQTEPDRVEFEAHGLPCLLLRGPAGAWCGYAAVPPGHPAHDVDYNEVDVTVHGGLTYGERCQGSICHIPKPGEPEDVFWLGFDCAHAGDVSPKYDHLYPMGRIGGYEESYKTVDYVRRETEELAEQLAKLGRT